MEKHIKIRKAIVFGGVFFLALSTIATIVSTSSRFTAEVEPQPLTINRTIIEPCKELVDPIEGITAATPDVDCVCTQGSPPGDVPGSVKTSRDTADTTAAGTQQEVTAVATAAKNTIEKGDILTTLLPVTNKVYDNETVARQELQKVWSNSIVPRLRVEYYELGWTKVNARTTTSGNQAKSFFSTRYSKDLDRWGPQATGSYTFLRNGNANVTGTATLGGFSYNGQTLNTGFANFSLRGTWNIAGDQLQAVAAYDCEIGDASGSTSVNGRWTNVGVQAGIPVWIKSGNSAYKITLQFGVNFVDKRVSLPFGLSWNF